MKNFATCRYRKILIVLVQILRHNQSRKIDISEDETPLIIVGATTVKWNEKVLLVVFAEYISTHCDLLESCAIVACDI